MSSRGGSGPGGLEALVTLSRALGDAAADYAILGEGNTSLRTGEDTFLVKSSGSSLADATPESFVEVRLSAVLALLDRPPRDDEELAQALVECRVDGGDRPSVEVALHALGLTIGGATAVGHTHPVEVNAILCSRRPELIVAGPLFPDQIVVCGRRPLLVPYVDPGIPLAIEVRNRLRHHIDRHGHPPKTIYLQNHGLIALGRSGAEVLQVTQMATKAARILRGTLECGGPQPLTDEAASRIEGRPDEHHRQTRLGLSAG
ncbi:MAG: class II aldolase/adducin family protein [Solirubrobacterales bacterium]|nr:class II aldolase/adducin family protein [Solirubrobacterales bacterium]